MPPLRAMIDTNIVHALSADPDTLAMLTKLLVSGTVQLLITHLQGDQLSKAPPHIRKTARTLDLTIINTDGVVWDVSKLDRSDWADETTKKRMSRVQGMKKRSSKQWVDTLISVTATGGADVYVTNDKQVRNAVKRIVVEDGLNLRVWNYAEFVGHIETLYATL
jgi:rRNA-processing protein FCF1